MEAEHEKKTKKKKKNIICMNKTIISVPIVHTITVKFLKIGTP